LGGVVFPAQQLEQFIIPGLDTKADSIHAQTASNSALRGETLPGFASTVHSRSGKIETVRKPPEGNELCRGQRRGVPPPTIVSGATASKPAAHHFTEERLAESLRLELSARSCRKRSMGKSARRRECGRKGV
jgi:hypothetical protein